MQETTSKPTQIGTLIENRKPLWGYSDLSEAVGIPVSTLQKYVHRKLLVPLKFGRSVRFDPEETIRRLKEIGRSNVS